MSSIARRWALLLLAASGLLASVVGRAAEPSPPLVSAAWLKTALAAGDVLVLDASPGPMHRKVHIPGAVPADVFGHIGRDVPPAVMQERVQRWGVNPQQRIVVYDQGGTYFAPRLYFDLFYLGVPAERLMLLDGGLAAWQAAGGAVTDAPTPPPIKGTFRVAVRDDARVRLDEFLVASGDPKHQALVDALGPEYHFGQAKFFDRAGHVPNAISLPAEDFFNADKTFKSADEIRRMAAYRGIRPEMTVHAHCGGGGAAAVPFFGLRFVAGYPKVKLYNESQREWLQDERELPLWTFDAPAIERRTAWLAGWNAGMLRLFGLAQLSVIDVRDTPAYEQGHLPYALNLPAALFAAHLRQPDALAARLATAGVSDGDEAVIVSDGGLTPSAALAFVMLERLGQRRVSVLIDSVDDWALSGQPITKQPTIVGAPSSPQDLAVPPGHYAVAPRDVLRQPDAAPAPTPYPRVLLAVGERAPTANGATLVHLPYRELLQPSGAPKAAKDVLTVLQKAGVPRYAQIVCVADDPGQAAVAYVVLKLMGWPDVKVQLI